MNKSLSERFFDMTIHLVLLLVMFLTIYPMLYVAFASISNASKLAAHTGFLFHPEGFSLMAYKMTFENPNILTSYGNTLFYVIAGTTVNLVMTTIAAYALSRKGFYWRSAIMLFIVFTMFFSGGLIPSYLLVKTLGFVNTVWAIIIPKAIGTYNLIIMRTAFQSIPESMEESARLDGAKDLTILVRIIIPLSMPVISVMILFYGVANWNSWFDALVFLRDREKYPLQLILREILITSSTDNMLTNVSLTEKESVSDTIKYATVIIAVVPVLSVYPFLQKYFVKGVMTGAIKG